ncbi:MAG: hypothetical protein XD76_1531 [candidate division TA06 bacterium 32_111]|jgi:hypothetical protein|nr:MAG: hypothetical protein XD76_1531 [candidate division TA06 bacterium 32_111]
MKEHIIKEILRKEWKMFINVQNKGGKALCQEDHKTFTVMRSSQFESLPINILESYYHDLAVAERQGRNLMTEKYARMMESTAPLEYEEIKNLLVEIDSESQKYIEKIIPVFLEWEKELRLEYPYLSSISRPAFSSEDSLSTTSFETYLKAELSTYSSNTLQIYYNFIKRNAENNINLSRKIQSNIVAKYGYNSLQEANDSVKRKLQNDI